MEVSAKVTLNLEKKPEREFNIGSASNLQRSTLIERCNNEQKSGPPVNLSMHAIYHKGELASKTMYCQDGDSIIIEPKPKAESLLNYEFSSRDIAKAVDKLFDKKLRTWLQETPQLGIVSEVLEFARHTRWHYLKHFISNLKHLGEWGQNYIDSPILKYRRNDLFILWFLALQYGHVKDLYIGERYITWQMMKLTDEELKKVCDLKNFEQTIRDGAWTRLHRYLALMRLSKPEDKDIHSMLELLENQTLAKEKEIFYAVRELTYIDMDSRISMNDIQIDAARKINSLTKNKWEIDEHALNLVTSTNRSLVVHMQEKMYIVPGAHVLMYALSKMSDIFPMPKEPKAENIINLINKMSLNSFCRKGEQSTECVHLFSTVTPAEIKPRAVFGTIENPNAITSYVIKENRTYTKWRAFTQIWSIAGHNFTEFFWISFPDSRKDTSQAITMPSAIYSILSSVKNTPEEIKSTKHHSQHRCLVYLASFIWKKK
eukprot:TRINITY_DN3979_c0_g1_i1.p1 TRINITY_DN3979_c0_g1~~TRINITY_DN3979_c0_g1_i1.p1  ORF type:complete len:487 (-),score=25.37 TRINITY_DN3979_c0_g1_i1:558-2018(-)